MSLVVNLGYNKTLIKPQTSTIITAYTMAYRIQEGGFSSARFYAHQLGEKAQVALSRLKKPKHPSMETSGLLLKHQDTLHGFPVSEIVYTDVKGSHTLLAVNLTNCSFAMKEAHGEIGKNRKTTEDGPHIALALGPVAGDYITGFPENTRYVFFASTQGKQFGSACVQDRFIGIDTLLNTPFSGGLTVKENGELDIVGQEGITDASEKGHATAQLFYTATDNTAATLANQYWEHFGNNERIGSSAYTWSWYYKDEDKLLYLCPKKGAQFQNNLISFDQINVINTQLAKGKKWKTALADSGLGGGFVIRNETELTYASHPHPELFHSVPLILIAKSSQRP